jgi:hypothetical protein
VGTVKSLPPADCGPFESTVRDITPDGSCSVKFLEGHEDRRSGCVGTHRAYVAASDSRGVRRACGRSPFGLRIDRLANSLGRLLLGAVGQ